MKIHKKFGFGLVLITGLFAGLFFAQTSSAAPSFSATWIDRSNIQVTGEGKTVVLNDKQWDRTWQYLGNIDGCDTSTLDGFDGDLIVGFSDNNARTSSSAWNDSTSNAGSLIVKYKAATKDTSCTTAEIKPIHINNWQNARIAFRWTDDTHTTITRIDDGDNWTFGDLVQITSGFDNGKTRFFRQSEVGDTCQDVIDVSADKSTMWLYEQIDHKTGTTSYTKSPVDPTQCWLKSTIDDLYPGSASVNAWNERIPSDYAILLEEADAVPQSTSPGASTKTGSVTGSDEACYSSNWALSWVACPVITVAQTLANEMYEFVENQLKFTVSPDGKTKDSLGDKKTREEVKSAWNNFRILVSGLVVILMLVMVISQAIGSGPFDAYTVRKMLPRLVAGVILIQLSWPIFAWVINVADDLGRGLADIIYAPFGGADALNLKEVMAPYADSSKDGQTALLFSWFTFLGGVVTLVVAPFLVLGAILTILVAIFVAFLTLLFRKILIILALITVPVALIAWMMPNDGLRRYWKIWWDNFLKALMMFPLIILIIAAGRIFAKIGSGQSDLVGFFIVLVGFFGPLFILPKTFKWGGTAMTAAGNALQKAQTATLKKPKEFLGERQKGYRTERTLQSQERFARNEGFNWRRPWRRPIDVMKSGKYDPTMLLAHGLGARRMRERAMATYVEKGEKAQEEDLNANEAQIIRERQRVRATGGNHDRFVQAVADGYYEDAAGNRHDEYIWTDRNGNEQRVRVAGRSDMQRKAARKQAAKLSAGTNNRHLEHYYESALAAGGEEEAEMRRFFDENTDLLIERLPHIYKSLSQASDMRPKGIVKAHGVEIESVSTQLGNLAGGMTRLGRAPVTAQEQREVHQALTTAPRDLVRIFTDYLNAAQTETLKGDLEGGGLRFVKAVVSGDLGLVAEDQAERRRLGLPELDAAGAARIRAAIGPQLTAQLDQTLQRNGDTVTPL